MSFITGAGMGMKSPRKRNFEAGILTDDPKMLLMNILIRFFALFLQKYPLFWKLFVNLHPKANMMTSPVFIYLVSINVVTFFMYGIDK